jgi:hypothetical protein
LSRTLSAEKKLESFSVAPLVERMRQEGPSLDSLITQHCARASAVEEGEKAFLEIEVLPSFL